MTKLEQLVDAIERQDKVLIRNLLQEDSNLVKRSDSDGWGPLHFSASKGDPEITKLLLEEFGANINQKTEYSYTPALIAAQKHHIGCLLELAQHGADLHITDRAGKSIIDFLAENDPSIRHIIDLNPTSEFQIEHVDGHLKIAGGEYSVEVH